MNSQPFQKICTRVSTWAICHPESKSLGTVERVEILLQLISESCFVPDLGYLRPEFVLTEMAHGHFNSS